MGGAEYLLAEAGHEMAVLVHHVGRRAIRCARSGRGLRGEAFLDLEVKRSSSASCGREGRSAEGFG